MKLIIATPVEADYRAVYSAFNRELFIALSPPFPKVTLLKFGMQRGDEVELRIGFGRIGVCWVSKITETYETDDEIGFVDEGVKLPLMLQHWRHRHRIVKHSKGAVIVDEIEYKARPRFLNGVLYPFLWLQFYYRKPIYRQYFGFRKK